MVQFDDLRMSLDKQTILVECHVKDYDAFANMYIKSIKIEYYAKRGTPGVPGTSAITMYENTNDDTAVKQVRTSLTVASLDAETFGTDKFENGMFYITVTCDGTLVPTTTVLDCGEDNTVDIGILFDWELIYSIGMSFVTDSMRACKSCEPNTNFNNFILTWNGLKLSADACDYEQLDNLWKKISNTGSSVVGQSGCGC